MGAAENWLKQRGIQQTAADRWAAERGIAPVTTQPAQSTPIPMGGLQMRAANGVPVMLSDIESAPPEPQGNFPQRVSQTIGNWFVHSPVGRTAAEVATPIVQAETLGAANVGDVPQMLPPPQSVAEAISRQGAKAATNLALMTNVIPNPGGAVAKGVGALTGGGLPGYAIGLPAFTAVNEALDPNQTVYEKVRSAVQSPVSMPVEAIRAPINAYQAATAEPPINPPTTAERVYQTGEALQPAVLAALPFIIHRAGKQAETESPPRPGASSAEVTRGAPPPDLLPFQSRPPITGKPIEGATFEPTVVPQPEARVAPAPISEVPGVPTTINEAIAKAMTQEIANAKEAGIRAQEAGGQEGVIGGESGRLRLRDDAQNRLEAQAGDEGRLRGVREPAQPVPPAEEVVSGAAAEPSVPLPTEQARAAPTTVESRNEQNLLQRTARPEQVGVVAKEEAGASERAPTSETETSPQKAPWEMTADEFANASYYERRSQMAALTTPEIVAYAKKKGVATDEWITHAPDDALAGPEGLKNKAAAALKSAGIEVRNVGKHMRVPGIKNERDWVVRRAASEGKVIPPEVLADYPDLKPSPAPGVSDAPIVKEAPGASETQAETPRESVGLTKADQNQMREAFDLPKLEQAKRKGWEKSVAGAKEKGLDAKAIEIAEEVQRDPRMLNDEERAAITLKATELNNEIPASQKLIAELTAKGDTAAAKVEQARADALLEQLDTVTKAGRYAGSEVGRALNSIKVRFFKDNYELAPVLQRARESRGRELSPDEQLAFTELVAKHEAIVKERDALQATHDKYVLETNAKLAERELQRQSRRGQIEKGTAERRARLFKERTEIKKRIAALGYQVNVGVPPELAIEVGKLAVNYWKEGVGTISDVAKKVVADLPTLNELDVYGAILAREPRRQAKAMSEATRRVSDLKKQAALMLEAEGLDPAKIAELRKNSYKAIDNPTKLERVLEKIDELQKHLQAGTRPAKKARPGEPDTPEIKSAKEQLADIRREMKVEDDIAKLQAQIASGDIPVRQRPEQRIRNRHLEEKEIALRKARHAIETKISEGKKRGVLGIIGEVAEVPKATQASGDVSATLMQGLLLGARHPIDASRAFVNAMGDMFSPERAERTYQQIVSDPRHYLAEKAGLRFNEPAPLPGEGQEMFASKVINAIPVLGSVVRGSNRHMTTHLNLLRHYAFNRFLDANPNAPMSELKGLANVLNVFSGYGDIGANPGAEKWLRRIFRAPRLAAARLQTPWMLAKHWSEPRVRGEIIKTFGSAAAIGTSIMSMAAMTGAKVGMDPDKGDFGKISYGAKHYDIFPGFTALARLVAIGGKRLAERVHLIKKGKGEVDLFDQAARNAIYKLNPVLSLGKELITGKDVFGKKVGVGEAFSHLLPFSIQTGIEATKVEGAKSIAQTAIPAAFGVGVSTYNDKKKRQ